MWPGGRHYTFRDLAPPEIDQFGGPVRAPGFRNHAVLGALGDFALDHHARLTEGPIMRRRIRRLIALLAAVTTGLGLAATASAQVTMKLAHYAPETHPAHLAAKQFAARVEEWTKGQVKITIYPANTLGSPPENDYLLDKGYWMG